MDCELHRESHEADIEYFEYLEKVRLAEIELLKRRVNEKKEQIKGLTARINEANLQHGLLELRLSKSFQSSQELENECKLLRDQNDELREAMLEEGSKNTTNLYQAKVECLEYMNTLMAESLDSMHLSNSQMLLLRQQVAEKDEQIMQLMIENQNLRDRHDNEELRKLKENHIMDSHLISNATKFLNFLNKSPTPFHVVESARGLLVAAGFTELQLHEQWQTKPGGKYFTTKNESTIVAFKVGRNYKPGNPFAIVGAHTDSPNLRVKLNSRKERCDYLQVGVECYGGGIWATWFDRDLTVAGRVFVRNGDKVEQKLVHIGRPILRIPHLAIHLNREVNDKFGPNKENHIVPILATTLNEQAYFGNPGKTPKSDKPKEQIEKHHPLLIDLIKRELNLNSVNDIYDLELSLVDTQPAQLGGAVNEFIFGARLDNQVGAYCTLRGLIDSCENEDSNDDDDFVRLAALYDHEEIGSESAQGAASALTEHIMRRLCSGGEPGSFELAAAKSFLISADQAHAVHPNYSEMHEENHRVSMNNGVVIKYNGNQRYATNTYSASMIRECGKLANVPVQDFMVKNDSPCGSTIGPILSSKLGMTTVDIGTAQLSMHSCRETGSTASITQLSDLVSSFYKNYTKVRKMFF